jgi:WD40 repeat protein
MNGFDQDVSVDASAEHDNSALLLQVCGLKWSTDDREIASGGNDNQLYVWGLHSTSPLLKFSDHTAAVKAIAWSPHQHGLLASGGGTADRCIRFWNTTTAAKLSNIDTGAGQCAWDGLHFIATVFLYLHTDRPASPPRCQRSCLWLTKMPVRRHFSLSRMTHATRYPRSIK